MSTLTHTDVPTFTPTATQIDCEEENVTIKVLPSVVSVYIRKPQEIVTGTGFIVDSENGYIITASHVIAGAEPGNIEVRFRDGSAKSAYYVAHYTDADIALLSVGHTGFPALPFVSNLSDISLSQGKPLIAIGMVNGTYLPVPGIIRKVQKDTAGWTNLIADGITQQGMSGGPAINSCGQGIGIISLGGSDPTNGTVAIALEQGKIDALISYALAHPVPTPLPTIAATRTPTPTPTPSPIPTPTPVPLLCSKENCMELTDLTLTFGPFGRGADLNARLTNFSNKTLLACTSAQIFDSESRALLVNKNGPFYGVKLSPGEIVPVTIHVSETFTSLAYGTMKVEYFEDTSTTCN